MSVVIILYVLVVLFHNGHTQETACAQRSPLDYSVKQCPEGWIRYGKEKCFKVFYNPAKNQPDANESCKGMGATLASIKTDEERNFAVSYILQTVPEDILWRTWIGGFRRETLWFWSDYSVFEKDKYTWAPGHPADGDNCVDLDTHIGALKHYLQNWGKFFSTNCTQPQNFLCQLCQTDVRQTVFKVKKEEC